MPTTKLNEISNLLIPELISHFLNEGSFLDLLESSRDSWKVLTQGGVVVPKKMLAKLDTFLTLQELVRRVQLHLPCSTAVRGLEALGDASRRLRCGLRKRLRDGLLVFLFH